MRIRKQKNYYAIHFLCKIEGINPHYFMHCCAKNEGNQII